MSKEKVELKNLISNATKRNWDRLKFSGSDKLSSRANKKLSQKNIIPIEYFIDTNNVKFIETLTNYIKQLNKDIFDVLYSLSVNLLTNKNIINKQNVKKTLLEYNTHALIPELLNIELPNNEKDILGIIYQALLSEGEKNIFGSYYTINSVTINMTKDLNFSNNETFFDPCCGSGAFLLSLNNLHPKQIFGADINPIAVMLAKVNLLLKYPNYDFIPQIYCYDYLNKKNMKNKYDYIITNPPWGASNVKSISNTITSKESFSLFFEKAYYQLKDKGIIRFLFPESILNVKVHKDIRDFILKNGNLKQIYFYTNTFNGVTTKFVDILHEKNDNLPSIDIIRDNLKTTILKKTFFENTNHIFNILDNEDISIIEKVKKLGKYNLSNSTWALGVVTGDNKTKLSNSLKDGFEKIYTGKEIIPFKLKPVQNYIKYDRKQLQQVAKEEIYRAKEKLVYKFISNKLVFAYDNSSSLFLNSANILIPQIPKMSIKTVLGFLNSELYQYLYNTLFAEVKILKGNLIQLPFIEITKEEDELLSTYVQNIIDGDDSSNHLLQKTVFKLFNLNDTQIKHIKEKIYGTTNK